MNDRSKLDRRTYLSLTGAALGGITVGPGPSTAQARDRFIVDVRAFDFSDVEVVHRLDRVGLAVVRGGESAVQEQSSNYVRDIALTRETTVEPREPERTESATDEPFYRLQWDKQIQSVPDAHAKTRGDGSRVAVIDTGVDPSHPDLQHAVNEDLSRNFTADGGDYTDVEIHGTHVSGLIAADDRNELGIAGTAPGTDLVALRVFDSSGGANYGDVLAAIVYGVEIGADVANLSLGTYPVPVEDLESFHWKAMNRTTAYANRKGTLLVGAAGDDGADLQHDGGVVSVPTEAAQVHGVSATGPEGFDPETGESAVPAYAPAPNTNYGTNAVELGAPGGNSEGSLRDWVLSTIPTDFGFSSPYAYLTGTSMAAAQVSGAAALLASATDYPDPAQANVIESVLRRSASVPDGYERRYYGSGFVDVVGALEEIGGGRGRPDHAGKSGGRGPSRD